MSCWLIAEFQNKNDVAAAIRVLRAGGATPDDLDLFSEEPVEFPHGVLDRPSSMSVAAVTGAILVGGLATLGVWAAQHQYALTTGGMPIFSFWGTGVITYETTMLGAVLATFGWFLWESGLLRKRDRTKPVPVVPPGSICLRVRCPAPDNAIVESLRRAGAISIDRREARA
jgi:hypothetical protein